MPDQITENLDNLRSQIAAVCHRCGRDPREITVLAVTKTFPAEIIRRSIAAGLLEIGESRVQEAEAKFTEVGHIGRYHLIGHLQSNKVKKAVQFFDVIQSVDSVELARAISRRSGEAGRTIECLVEVNSSGEDQKYGVPPERTSGLISDIRQLSSLELRGVMTVGPLTEDDDLVRAAFRVCRKIFDEARTTMGERFSILSMGMSSDFQAAIEEGSTMIRIGTGLFGARTTRP